MKHLFVGYKVALELKEKGFDEPCFGHFYGNDEVSFPRMYRNSNSDEIASPIYQQVIDWLDSGHHCLIYYSPYLSKAPRQYELFIWYRGNTIKLGCFDSLEKGYNKAIEEALKLI